MTESRSAWCRACMVFVIWALVAGDTLAQSRPGETAPVQFTLTSRTSVVVEKPGISPDSPPVLLEGRVFSRDSRQDRFMAAFSDGALLHIDLKQARVSWWLSPVPKGVLRVFLPSVQPRSSGNVQREGSRVGFLAPMGGRATLQPAQPLVGRFDTREVQTMLPAYGSFARDFEVDEAGLLELQQVLPGRSLRVVVLFGSWCPSCERFVPRMLRLAELLQDVDAQFEFFGIAATADDVRDEVTERWGVRQLPEAIVLLGQAEVARIRGPDGFRRPARSLARLLRE